MNNEERSIVEVKQFCEDPPDKYFLYVKSAGRTVTTWLGDKLGDVVCWGRVHRSNMGDRRRYIQVKGINGRAYWGWFYMDSGDYARIYAYKNPDRLYYYAGIGYSTYQ